MFPVYIKRDGTEPPVTPTHYIIAKNGIFLRKKNEWVDAVVPVKQIAVLEDQTASAKVLLPALSSIVIAKTVKFFKAVYDKQYSEALVLLHYDKKLGWEMSVPKQEATFAHVGYDRSERIEGYTCVGTIHSHSSMYAFHSSVDKDDEKDWDGVHITIGDFNEENSFSIDVEAVVNDSRFPIDVSWLEGVSEVEEATPKHTGWLLKWTGMWNFHKKLYTVHCPEVDDWQTPEEWIQKVEKVAYLQVVSTTPTCLTNISAIHARRGAKTPFNISEGKRSATQSPPSSVFPLANGGSDHAGD